MAANRKPTRRVLRDADDAPDLSTPAWKEKFDTVAVKRGRPPSTSPKVSTTIRLDKAVLDHFRAGGAGWQSRLNAALRKLIAA
jgi:uncharacterized protein (DUF4415 family)